MIKVSVIMPVYNVGKYLNECIDSVINQTLKDIEIICIDDGSRDNSLNILNSYKEKDNRIHIIQQQNQYAGIARNNGLKMATGKYIIFLDSDDWFDRNMLESMYNQAEKDNSDIVICGWKNFNNLTKNITNEFEIQDDLINISPFSPEEIADKLFIFNKPNPWTKLYRRDFFIEKELCFEDVKCYNDMTCVYTSYLLANKISVMKDCFVYYRNNQKSNLTSQWDHNFECLIKEITKIEKILKNLDLYDLYKNSFDLRMKSLFNNRFKKLSEYTKRKMKIECRKILSEDLYFLFFNTHKPNYRPNKKTIVYDKFF